MSTHDCPRCRALAELYRRSQEPTLIPGAHYGTEFLLEVQAHRERVEAAIREILEEKK